MANTSDFEAGDACEAASLGAALDLLARPLGGSAEPPSRRRGRRRGGGDDAGALSVIAQGVRTDTLAALKSWDASAPINRPSTGLLATQVEEHLVSIKENRYIDWLRGQRALRAKFKKPDKDKVSTISFEDMPPEVVQEALDESHASVTRTLQVHEDQREARVCEHLALRIEQTLCCDPPHYLRDILPITSLRVVAVEPGSNGKLDVRISSDDVEVVARKLTKAAPAISRALAYKFMLYAAPNLRFIAGERPTAEGRPVLWKHARAHRKKIASSGALSFEAEMTW